MKEMYWMDVIGNISTTTAVFAAVSIFAAIMFLIAMVVAKSDDENDDFASCRKWAKRFGIVGVVFILITVFTPSTKSLYLIYGVGGTLDYIKSNDKAKQLPDKVINALDRWIDSQTEDNKKNDGANHPRPQQRGLS